MTTSEPNIFELPGDVSSDPNDLKILKARAVASAIQKLPFVRLVDCRKDSNRPNVEIVVVEVDVERAQSVYYDIRRVETLDFLRQKIEITRWTCWNKIDNGGRYWFDSNWRRTGSAFL